MRAYCVYARPLAVIGKIEGKKKVEKSGIFRKIEKNDEKFQGVPIIPKFRFRTVDYKFLFNHGCPKITG